MTSDPNDDSEQLTLAILKALSHRLVMSVSEITKAVRQGSKDLKKVDEKKIESTLGYLEHLKFVTKENGKHKITRQGLDHLLEKGYSSKHSTAGVNVDKTARKVLLFLSSKQSLSLAEIAKQLDMKEEQVIDAVVSLEDKQYVQGETKYKISPKGNDYINKKGMASPKGKESEKKRDQEFKIPLFGSVLDAFIWFIIFSVLFLVLITVILLIARDVSSTFLKYTLIILFLAVWITILVLLLKESLIKVPEYEKRVIFRIGKMIGARGPGLIFTLPLFDEAKTVDMRIRTSEVALLSCITQDNIQATIDFVFLWKIKDPEKSMSQVKDLEESVRLLASAVLRTVVAQFNFDYVSTNRDAINEMLKNHINKTCEDWGIIITHMELREIKPPEDILQAMHRRTAAEWDSQATVTDAEAQANALRLFTQSAEGVNQRAMSLKYLEMLNTLGQGESTKYVLPIELTKFLKPLIEALHKEGGADNAPSSAENNGEETSVSDISFKLDTPKDG